MDACRELDNEWNEFFDKYKESDLILQFDGIAWTSFYQLTRYQSFPEIIEMDTTAKTNILNAPLFFCVFHDSGIHFIKFNIIYDIY